MSKIVYFVGNNLAVLIAANELVKAGYQVKIFTDDGVLGGVFSGLKIEERDFDLGMFLFEQAQHSAVSIRSSINSWLNNAVEVSDWLSKKISLKLALTPEVYFEGALFPDYIISNRLDLFFSSNVNLPCLLDKNSPFHASKKESGEQYDKISFYDAAKYNHGEDFHLTYIEPFVKKITGYSSKDFLARYHRFSWAPLFYPETLINAVKNRKASIPEYRFWTTKNGFAGDLVRGLKEEILCSDGIEIITNRLFEVRVAGGELVIDGNKYDLCGSKVVLGLSMNRMHELLGSDKRLSGAGVDFTLAIMLIHRDQINNKSGCVFIVGSEFSFYRVTNQDLMAGLNPEWHRVVVEANTDVLKRKYTNTALTLEACLVQEIKMYFSVEDVTRLRVLKILSIRNGLYLPTCEFIRLKRELSADLFDLTEGCIEVTGDLLGYGTSSINNQIEQGLKIGEVI